MRCEDYPCCGHTDDDPCEVMPYDAPDYYDTSLPGQEHRLCNHEEGECDVEDDYDEDECDECGEPRSDHDRSCSRESDHEYWDGYEDAAMESGLWGSEA